MPSVLFDLHDKLSNEFTDKKFKSCNAVKKIKIFIIQNAKLQQMQQKKKWTSMIQ
jgi:hypothetical protein